MPPKYSRLTINKKRYQFIIESEGRLHTCVLYLVQKTINRHRLNRHRLKQQSMQPNENGWPWNVVCTSRRCISETNKIKIDGLIDGLTPGEIKSVREKAKSIFVDMKRRGTNKVLDEFIRPNHDYQLVEGWLNEFRLLCMEVFPISQSEEVTDSWIAEEAVEGVELAEEQEEEEVAVMCRAMTQHDQIANLVHEIKKFQISNTVTDTSDQHANEIQALTTRIEKRKGASM